MSKAKAASSERALNAILPQISGSPYEAHQKARTFASRYVKSGQYDTAIDVLFQSARELLKVGQSGSGVDLASFLLEVYDSKPEPISEESRGELLVRSFVEVLTDWDLDREVDSTHRVMWTSGRLEKDYH